MFIYRPFSISSDKAIRVDQKKGKNASIEQYFLRQNLVIRFSLENLLRRRVLNYLKSYFYYPRICVQILFCR
jgi:hypothetical protein